MSPYAYSYNPILVIAAVVPAIFLMIQVYKADRLEKESGRLLFSLAVMGILSTFFALVCENIGSFVLDTVLYDQGLVYNILMYFIVVGCSEEGGKYILLKFRTWKNPEFNCQFDGVVYAVFVSLGFALWENIDYVALYGFSVAVTRALTAVPGHACFGVIMGIFYGQARRYAYAGEYDRARSFRKKAFWVPALVHGTYDFICTMDNDLSGMVFLGFVLVMFVVCRRMVKVMSANDKYISAPPVHDDFWNERF